jgi:molybdopterin molybdotransferase
LRNLSVAKARERMLVHAPLLDMETVPLEASLGRCLAESVSAARDQPPFDASAMDGWAMRRADARRGAALRILGESAAGRPFAGTLGPGEAVRIFTGAALPPGADFVVIQEEARRDGERVALTAPDPATGPAYVRPRGGDLAAGVRVLEPGQRLDPWRVALAAAAGARTLAVRRRPTIAILTTGEELAAPGEAPTPWQIADSAGPGLSALVETFGGAPRRLRPVGDDIDAIVAAVAGGQAAAGAPADLIVAVGGASVGDHDLVKPALARLGLTLSVETVNVRPGKPTWFGLLADGRRVLGLPGNPASAFVCAELFLRPLICAMLGAPAEPALIPAVLARDLPANGPREHWMRASLSVDGQGRTIATPFEDQDSSLVGVFARADALLRREAGAGAIAAGGATHVTPLRRA